MNALKATLLGSLASAVLMISVSSLPSSADVRAEGTGRVSSEKFRDRRAYLGAEGPWISIMLRHRSELNLTPAQVATLEKLRGDYEQQVTPRRMDLKSTETEIARLLQEGAVDMPEVKAKIAEAEKIRAGLRYHRIETLEVGKSVLTAEQRDQLKNLTASGHRRFRKPQGTSSS